MRILRNSSVVVLTVVAAIAVWFFGYAWDREVLRYRLTYEVETPRGVVEGSGVIQTSREDTTRLPFPNTGYGYSNTGEAVVVDLGDDRYLFALLKRGLNGKGSPQELPFQAFADLSERGLSETPVEFFRRLKQAGASTELPTNLSPLLVTFGDNEDPKTVKHVDPRDLKASFGPGFRLKRITVSVTDEPVTRGRVEQVLNWILAVGRERGQLIPKPNGIRARALSDMTTEEKVRAGDFLSTDYWRQ